MSPSRPATAGQHPRPPAREARRPAAGPHLGPIRITPIRVTIAIAFLGSGGYIAWAILRVRDASQIPMLSAGFGVLGLAFAAVALGGLISLWRAASDDRPGRAMLLAVGGGLAGLCAIVSWALAVVLALVWRA